MQQKGEIDYAEYPAMLAAAQPITDYLSTALAAALFLFTYRKYFPKADKSK